MTKIKALVARMAANPQNIRFADLQRVCNHFFGDSRQDGSHHIYKTPWPGDPRVNIQPGKNGMAKVYQVRQVLAAIFQLNEWNEEDDG
ncbi:toxin HicA [Pannus brasiliensis CCIBt3594]|uniref:Toxin HicA n=1 Tax=Pannus brasiliensis CCIBt3594 TaxID=1427578 RepID=A0AAW9QIU0_9CHRO